MLMTISAAPAYIIGYVSILSSSLLKVCRVYTHVYFNTENMFYKRCPLRHAFDKLPCLVYYTE